MGQGVIDKSGKTEQGVKGVIVNPKFILKVYAYWFLRRSGKTLFLTTNSAFAVQAKRLLSFSKYINLWITIGRSVRLGIRISEVIEILRQPLLTLSGHMVKNRIPLPQ